MEDRRDAAHERIRERALAALDALEQGLDSSLGGLFGEEDPEDAAEREQMEAYERELERRALAQAAAIGERNRGGR